MSGGRIRELGWVLVLVVVVALAARLGGGEGRRPAPGVSPSTAASPSVAASPFQEPKLEPPDERGLALAISPDGKRVARGAERCVVYDVATGAVVSELRPVLHDTWALAFSPDGTQVAMLDGARRLTLWETATGRLVGVIARNVPGAFSNWRAPSLAFDAGGRYLACSTFNTRVYSLPEMDFLGEVRGRHGCWVPGFLGTLEWSEESARGTVHVARVAEGRLEGTQAVSAEELPWKGRFIAVGTGGFLQIGEGLGASAVRPLAEPVEPEWGSYWPRHRIFSPDGRYYARGIFGAYRVRDGRTGAVVTTVGAHSRTCYLAAFSRDGSLLATTVLKSRDEPSQGDLVRVWEASTGRRVAVLGGAWKSQGEALAAVQRRDGDDIGVPESLGPARPGVTTIAEMVKLLSLGKPALAWYHKRSGTYVALYRPSSGDPSFWSVTLTRSKEMAVRRSGNSIVPTDVDPSSWATALGVRLGDPQEKVLRLYGGKAGVQYVRFTWADMECLLAFECVRGRVEHITLELLSS